MSAREATRRSLQRADRLALCAVVAWAAFVLVALVGLTVREVRTMAYPVARILFEDQFNSLGDGHLIPLAGEVVPPALAALFMAPVFWLHAMAYYPLADLLGSAGAVIVERTVQLTVYLLGAPLVYCLLRRGKADRWVAVLLAATYAIAPFPLSRMLLCNSLAAAPFLLWSELGRIQGRPLVRAIGLIAATWSYPMSGFSAVLLALQDYWYGRGPQRRTALWILIATAGALAVVHFGVLVLWNLAYPDSHELHVTMSTFIFVPRYPVFPFRLEPFLAQPVKLFEIAVYMATSCVFLVTRPDLWFPAAIDLAYFGLTEGGVRDHTMVLSSLALFTIIGVRAALFEGGNPRRNRWLVVAALFGTLYGHALAGVNGPVQLAFAPVPPPPHQADIGPCVPAGQKRCVVPTSLYTGFSGLCEEVATYEPDDLAELQIEDAATTVFVAPSRLDCFQKNTTCGPLSDGAVLSALAAKIRSGQLHATVCPPWFVLVHSKTSGFSDPAAADRLERPYP